MAHPLLNTQGNFLYSNPQHRRSPIESRTSAETTNQIQSTLFGINQLINSMKAIALIDSANTNSSQNHTELRNNLKTTLGDKLWKTLSNGLEFSSFITDAQLVNEVEVNAVHFILYVIQNWMASRTETLSEITANFSLDKPININTSGSEFEIGNLINLLIKHDLDDHSKQFLATYNPYGAPNNNIHYAFRSLLQLSHKLCKSSTNAPILKGMDISELMNAINRTPTSTASSINHISDISQEDKKEIGTHLLVIRELASSSQAPANLETEKITIDFSKQDPYTLKKLISSDPLGNILSINDIESGDFYALKMYSNIGSPIKDCYAIVNGNSLRQKINEKSAHPTYTDRPISPDDILPTPRFIKLLNQTVYEAHTILYPDLRTTRDTGGNTQAQSAF